MFVFESHFYRFFSVLAELRDYEAFSNVYHAHRTTQPAEWLKKLSVSAWDTQPIKLAR